MGLYSASRPGAHITVSLLIFHLVLLPLVSCEVKSELFWHKTKLFASSTQSNCWNNNTVQQTHGTALTVKKSHQPASCSASLLFVSFCLSLARLSAWHIWGSLKKSTVKHSRYCLHTLCRAESKMRLPLKHVHPAPCKNTHYPLA